MESRLRLVRFSFLFLVRTLAVTIKNHKLTMCFFASYKYMLGMYICTYYSSYTIVYLYMYVYICTCIPILCKVQMRQAIAAKISLNALQPLKYLH